MSKFTNQFNKNLLKMWMKLEKVKAVWIEHATVSMEGNLKLRLESPLKMKLLTIS